MASLDSGSFRRDFQPIVIKAGWEAVPRNVWLAKTEAQEA